MWGGYVVAHMDQDIELLLLTVLSIAGKSKSAFGLDTLVLKC